MVVPFSDSSTFSRSLFALAIVAFATAAFVGPAAAQDAPPASLTWYIRGQWSNTNGEGSYLAFQPPTDETDNTATCPACAGPAPFVVTSQMPDPLAASLYKATSGTASATVFLKSFRAAPAPNTQVTVHIWADDKEIATGALTQDVLLDAIVQYDVPLTLEPTSIARGTVIRMTVDVIDANAGVYNPAAYARGSSAEHPWSFTLPLVADGPLAGAPDVTAFYEIVGESILLNVAPTSATNDTAQYNWTSPLDVARITVNATGVSGRLDITIADGAGNVAYEARIDGDANLTEDIESLQPGEWSIVLDATGFVGEVSLSIAAPDAEPGSGGSGNGQGGAATLVAGDDAGGLGPAQTSEQSKGSPAPAFWLGLAAVAAALLAVRRRQT